jgi:hypothetical protein
MEGKLSWRMHPQSKSWLGDEDDEWVARAQLVSPGGSMNAENRPLLTDGHVECETYITGWSCRLRECYQSFQTNLWEHASHASGVVTPLSSHSQFSENGDVARSLWKAERRFYEDWEVHSSPPRVKNIWRMERMKVISLSKEATYLRRQLTCEGNLTAHISVVLLMETWQCFISRRGASCLET